MRDFTDRVLSTAQSLGAEYADVRVIDNDLKFVAVRKGNVERVSVSHTRGFGVRVLVDGAWGFASSAQVSKSEISEVVERAVRIARASALVQSERVELSPVDPVVDRYESGVKVDPFTIKTEDVIDYLLEADQSMSGPPEIRATEAAVKMFKENKVFASTEGSYIEQLLTHCGGGMAAYAVSSGEMQKRSYPGQFGGDYAARGWEFIEELDLASQGERVAREAVELVSAPQCPDGYFDIILEGSQLALQIHESCGHPIELDRVLGHELGYVGTSFLTPEKLNSFQYGSDIVNITADATIPGALGTFGYDDEGVPAQRTPIVRGGKFVGYLSSRETAAQLGLTSSGAMRAISWNKIPLVRMTNVNLEPGDWSLNEIIKNTKHGLFLDVNKSFSIDDRRLNFQFGTEVAWEIEDGELTRMLKNPIYSGMTPEFWNSCDAIAGQDEWRVYGIPNCGKGEPGQPMWVGHGAAPARFRQVKVGVGKW